MTTEPKTQIDHHQYGAIISKFRIMFVHYGWTLFGVFVENINFCTKCNSGNTGPFNFFCWKTASSLETQGHSLTLSSKVNLQLLRDGLRREKLKPFSPALKRGKIWKYIERKMMLRSKWLTLEHACLQLCMREILAVKNFAHFHQSLGKVKLLLAKQSPTFNGVFFPLQHKRLDFGASSLSCRLQFF